MSTNTNTSGMSPKTIIFVSMALVALIGLADSSNKTTVAASQPIVNPASATVDLPKWNTRISVDKITGKVSAYASSPTSIPDSSLGAYRGMKSWIGVGCDKDSEWAYIGFSRRPILNGTQTHSGYSSLNARVRWGKQATTIKMTQDWGDRFLHFSNGKSAIGNLAASSNLLLELDFYSEGKRYFKYSLNGSSAAIKSIRSTCRSL